MQRRSAAIFLILVLFLHGADLHAEGCDGRICPEAREYLDQALDIMQARSINRDKVDWPAIRQTAADTAAGANSPADTHEAIRGALDSLADGHSFLRLPDEQTPTPGEQLSGMELLTAQMLNESIAYIRIPGFSPADGGESRAFSQKAIDYIRELDESGVCRWVVDLRGNMGGNMWPMLHAVYPLLGPDTPGYFVMPEREPSPWRFNSLAELDEYRVSGEGVQIAVLQADRTASAAEAVVVAFRGLSNVRTFGEPTWGVSTANHSYVLADGAILNLTIAVYADRDGRHYGGSIVPDVHVSSHEARGKAVEWLLEQPACASEGA